MKFNSAIYLSRVPSKVNWVNWYLGWGTECCSCISSLLYEDSRGRFWLSCRSLYSHVCI